MIQTIRVMRDDGNGSHLINLSAYDPKKHTLPNEVKSDGSGEALPEIKQDAPNVVHVAQPAKRGRPAKSAE